ncbi:hypothetical protein Tco_0153594 [Tanacetum coccineum]
MDSDPDDQSEKSSHRRLTIENWPQPVWCRHELRRAFALKICTPKEELWPSTGCFEPCQAEGQDTNEYVHKLRQLIGQYWSKGGADWIHPVKNIKSWQRKNKAKIGEHPYPYEINAAVTTSTACDLMKGNNAMKAITMNWSSPGDPVMVKRAKVAGRRCVWNFTRPRNKACPLDCYPLLEIDWKVECAMAAEPPSVTYLLCPQQTTGGFTFPCVQNTSRIVRRREYSLVGLTEAKEAFHAANSIIAARRHAGKRKNKVAPDSKGW